MEYFLPVQPYPQAIPHQIKYHIGNTKHESYNVP